MSNKQNKGNSCLSSLEIESSSYDSALELSEEISKDEFNMGLALEPEASLTIICIGIALGICKCPLLLGVVGLFFVAVITSAVKYGKTKKLLRNHDVEGARAMLPSAKLWYRLSWISFTILAIVEFYFFIQIMKSFGDAFKKGN